VIHSSQGKNSFYQSKGTNLKESGKSWNSSGKLKGRTKLNGHGNYDISNENNHTDNSKHLIPQADHAGLSSAGDAKDGTTSPVAISTNAYNLLDFVTKYEQARCSGLFLSLLFSLSLFPGPP
jgi:YTH domain-containing family protein